MRCNWPGCKNHVKPFDSFFSKNPLAYTKHCFKHNYQKISGRVSDRNYKRDFYRENMKGVCELSKFTFKEAYEQAKEVLKNTLDYKFEKNKTMAVRIKEKREAIKLAMRSFDVDHIDGNHYNNDISNLQTLSKLGHHWKSMLFNDYSRYR